MRSVTLSTLITAGLIQPGAILQHRGYSCTLTGYGTLIPLEPRPMFLLPEYSSPSAWTTAIARKGNPASKASINGWEAVKCVINGSEVLLGNMRRKYAEEGGNIKGEWCAQDEEKYAKKKKKKRKNSMSHMMSRFKSAAEPSPAMIAAMQQAAREQQDERARQRAQQDLAELYSQRSATSAAAALTAAASRVNGTRPSQNGNGTPHLSHKRSHSSIDDSGDLVKGADVLLSIASKSKKESPEVKSEASNPPAGLESLAVEALLGMGTRVGA
ncbi:Protein rai1 [Saitoella coloradoensis]